MAWTLDDARQLAAAHLRDVGTRWDHSCAVGNLAEDLVVRLGLDEAVAMAAWVHDVGYGDAASETGLHALDGARMLAELGAPREISSLVAYHSGAEFEAQQRGLTFALAEFSRPAQDGLDALIFADMTTTPHGHPTCAEARLGEILTRYGSTDPVHLAVVRSREYLSACVARVEARLRSADEGLRASL